MVSKPKRRRVLSHRRWLTLILLEQTRWNISKEAYQLLLLDEEIPHLLDYIRLGHLFSPLRISRALALVSIRRHHHFIQGEKAAVSLLRLLGERGSGYQFSRRHVSQYICCKETAINHMAFPACTLLLAGVFPPTSSITAIS